MKRIIAFLLTGCLLAGCAAFGDGEPVQNAVVPAPTAAPQELAVWCDAATLPALQAYADAQNVALTQVEDPAAADLAVLDALPTSGEDYRDLMQDDLLAAAASRAAVTEGTCLGLPLGRTLYAYWADNGVLTALLGEGAAADLQSASWEEWEALADTLTDWLADPAETGLTLNGHAYTLPAGRPAGCEALGGVFAAPQDCGPGYTAALLAAGAERSADTLTGPLNGVYSAVALEWDHLAPDGTAALFTRGKLTDALAAAGPQADLVPVPFKCELVESDLSTEEYNLTGLMNYPVLAPAGYLAIPAAADEAGVKAAAGAILWLYGSAGGESALTETLCLVTPWDTASDATPAGARQVAQVGSGILPGVALEEPVCAALAQAEAALRGQSTRGSSERKTYVAGVLAALGVAEG
ncbi:MAG: hypothetical protein ACI4OI_07175 [Gemmiger sp.]